MMQASVDIMFVCSSENTNLLVSTPTTAVIGVTGSILPPSFRAAPVLYACQTFGCPPVKTCDPPKVTHNRQMILRFVRYSE